MKPSKPPSAPNSAAGDKPHYVSAREVAIKAGVSRSAVSRTMTPGAHVSPATRAKVLAAAEALGYEVNLLARGLLDERSGIVALVSASVGSPFMSGLLPAVTAKLLDAGYAPMLINIGRESERAEASLRLCMQLRSTAIVVLSGSPSGRFMETALQSGVPVIALNREDDGPDLIVSDNYAAGRQAFGVLKRGGAQRFLVLAPERWTASLKARAAGFNEAVQAVGNQPRFQFAVADPQDAATLDYRAGRAAAAEIFKASPHADGIFCLNDHTAFGLIDGARQDFDLHPRRDFAVIGFDDVPMADWASFRLSTFRQDPWQLASAILGTLEQRRALAASPPLKIVLRSQFVERETSALDGRPNR